MRYRPEIDGLRCVAVLAVVLHHAKLPVIAGGFLGVDVFFVISGFLITRIILDELSSGTFSILRFYERRVRRIAPALLFVLIVCVPFSWKLMVPFQYFEFSQSILPTLLFASNIFFWKNSDYFDASAEHKPLLHTWSLAVEEQFYLVFPIMILLLLPLGRLRLFGLIAFLTALSLAAAELAPEKYRTAAFFLLPTRAWELGIGCLLAFYPRLGDGLSLPAKQLLATIGLAAICASFFLIDHQMRLPGLISCVPVLGTALVISCASSDTFIGKILSVRPAVAIGTISFSLYLWHQPVFVFGRLHFGSINDWPTSAVLVGLSIGLAAFTYRFIEEPFRTRGTRGIPFRKISKVLMALSGLLVAQFVFASYEQRNNQFLLAKYDDNPAIFDAKVENERRSAWKSDPETLSDYYDVSGQSGARIIIIGDSHATDLFNLLHSQGQHSKLFPMVVPLFGGCMASTDREVAEQETRACISQYLDKEYLKPATHVLFSLLWTKFADDPSLLEIMIAAGIDEVKKRGKIAVVASGTYHSDPMLQFFLWKMYRDGSLDADSAASVAFEILRPDAISTKERLDRAVIRAGGIIFDRLELMCELPKRRCHALTPDGHAIYTDSNHTTLEGAAFLGQLARNSGKLDLFGSVR